MPPRRNVCANRWLALLWLTRTGGAPQDGVALASRRCPLAATPAPDCVAPKDPQRKFCLESGAREIFDQIWFTRIRSLTCKP